MSIITISRGTKSGGLEIAKRLAKKLDYKLLSREMVVAESAKKYNIMEEFLHDKLQKAPNLWQKFTNEYGRYIIYIRCSLLHAIQEDNIIYHGYAGQFFLKGLPHVLKLRIEAPLAFRVKALIKEYDYTYEKAVEYIKKVDERRKRWVKMLYNYDWYDPSLYDLWVNLQNMSMDNICEMVVKALDHKDFQTTTHAKRLLENLALECEVEAALVSDNKIWSGQKVSVHASNGVVTLKGAVKNKDLRNLIIDTTLNVKGVKDCKSDITLLSDSLST
jgi:cytidylate kinase